MASHAHMCCTGLSDSCSTSHLHRNTSPYPADCSTRGTTRGSSTACPPTTPTTHCNRWDRPAGRNTLESCPREHTSAASPADPGAVGWGEAGEETAVTDPCTLCSRYPRRDSPCTHTVPMLRQRFRTGSSPCPAACSLAPPSFPPTSSEQSRSQRHSPSPSRRPWERVLGRGSSMTRQCHLRQHRCGRLVHHAAPRR